MQITASCFACVHVPRSSKTAITSGVELLDLIRGCPHNQVEIKLAFWGRRLIKHSEAGGNLAGGDGEASDDSMGEFLASSDEDMPDGEAIQHLSATGGDCCQRSVCTVERRRIWDCLHGCGLWKDAMQHQCMNYSVTV